MRIEIVYHENDTFEVRTEPDYGNASSHTGAHYAAQSIAVDLEEYLAGAKPGARYVLNINPVD